MPENNYLEKRKYERIGINGPVSFRMMPAYSPWLNSMRKEAVCLNISRGGIQLALDEQVNSSEEQMIEAELKLMDTTIKVTGLVVWSKLDADINKYRTGIEFMIIKDNDREIIRKMSE
jgi:hypothetical protein